MRIRKLTPRNIKKLLKHFNLNSITDGRNFVVRRTPGNPSNRTILRELRRRYNDEQFVRNFTNNIFNNVRENRLNEIRENIARRRILNYINRRSLSISQWENYVLLRAPRFGAFRVTITSALIGVSKTFTFPSIQYFLKWIQDILQGHSSYDDANEFLSMNQDIFSQSFISVSPLTGGCNKNGNQRHNYTKKMSTFAYDFNLTNPYSKNHNCGIACLSHVFKEKLSSRAIRKEYCLPFHTPISSEVIQQIAKDKWGAQLQIIDENHEDAITLPCLMLKDEHYTVVESFQPKTKKTIMRGEMYFDFETRPCFHDYYYVGKTKAYSHKETICCVYYRRYKQKEFRTEILHTGRDFLDFLFQEHKENRHYHVFAHNGANFDFYFLIKHMTEREILNTRMVTKGYSVIKMNYYGNEFKDTCQFLQGSLENLCKSFKTKVRKATEFELHGKVVSNKELMFYQSHLDYDEFMNLKDTDLEFWKQYVSYCLDDCISLAELWGKFKTQVDNLITKMGVFQKCKLNMKATIASHAVHILNNIRKDNFKSYLTFLDDETKYKFVENFKRGGISHCEQPGKHEEPIVSYDITSQYPTALLNMRVPVGESEWVTEYHEDYHGYYLIKGLSFSNTGEFLPIAKKNNNTLSLKWNADYEPDDEMYISSEMIKYLPKFKFTVVKGLVSKESILGSDLFGKYVNILFEEKKKQDYLKSNGNPEYNPAYRETIKLYLNSVTGKLVEDVNKHKNLNFKPSESEASRSAANINGVSFVKTQCEEYRKNIWLNAGVCVYDYSKMLLFEYINLLPNKGKDIIHVETDGIYFHKKDEEHFLEQMKQRKQETFEKSLRTFPIDIGSELGNVKKEHESKGNSYFLMKKTYAFYCKNEESYIMKMKGIPNKTIDSDGKVIKILKFDDYEALNNGQTVKYSFATLKKQLFGRTKISSLVMSREIKVK